MSDGYLSLENVQFVASSTGAFETYIKATSGAGNGLMIDIGLGVGSVSKGATMSATSKITTANGARIFNRHNNVTASSSAQFTNYTVGANTFELPFMDVRTDEFQKSSVYFSRINGARILGYFRPQITAITANASTFSATSRNLLQTANTLATNLDGLTDGEDGQEITLLINDANTTIRHNIGGSGRFLLTSGANETPASGAVYKFVQNSNVWRQI